MKAAQTDRIEIVAGDADEGLRLDRFLALHVPQASRSRLKTLILAGHVSAGDDVLDDPAGRVARGDVVTLDLPPPEAADPQPEAIPLTIVHEDADVIVLDKPAGLIVHPAPGNWTGTLVNALLAHCGDSLSGIGGVKRPGIVHRLDKETSGLIVVAKTDRAHRGLAAQFADHGRSGPLDRCYQAFVWGAPERRAFTVDAPIGRDSHHRQRMAVVRSGGRSAITHVTRIETFGSPPVANRVLCALETGRTHQIRVHLAHVGHPLLGDDVYGAGFRTKAARLSEPARQALEALNRQALHAAVLGFEHPISGEFLRFESPLPSDLARLHAALTGM
jgi:23S rRNA pseudouridine1911/1915/1917 synthase